MTKTKTSLIMLAFSIIASSLFITSCSSSEDVAETPAADTKTDLLNQYRAKKKAHQSALKSTLSGLGFTNSRSDDESVIEYVFSLTDDEVESLNQVSIIKCEEYENQLIEIIGTMDPGEYVVVTDQLYQSYIEFVDIDRETLSIPELEIVNYVESLPAEDQEVMLDILVAFNDYIDTMGEAALLSLFDRFPEAERACFEQVQQDVINIAIGSPKDFVPWRFIKLVGKNAFPVGSLYTSWQLLKAASDMHKCLNKANRQ